MVVACGSDDGDTGAGPTTTSVVPRPAPALSGDPFTLGVASGDPTADGVVLWTRLAPDSGAADGGMPADDVDVVFEIAKDSAFTDVVATGVATAVADLAHSVHVEVDGLDPNAEFHYRFSVGEFTSPAGVTRTFAPGDATLDRYRFAVAACQDFQFGRYGAWAHAAADGDLDAVVFMGDYVYELPPFDVSPEGDGSRMWRVEGATTLDDYRIRYAQVKEDSSLQSAHAMAPWLIVWDDHEVTDNYTGDTDYNDPDPVEFRKRRSAAYQAWYEHLPGQAAATARPRRRRRRIRSTGRIGSATSSTSRCSTPGSSPTRRHAATPRHSTPAPVAPSVTTPTARCSGKSSSSGSPPSSRRARPPGR